MKKIMIVFAAIMLLLLAGCSKEASNQQDVVKEAGVTEEPVQSNEPTIQQTAEPENEYEKLEITPSGDPKCFLSPCDCQCYPIPNVPVTAKKVTCATDCKDAYGITGCEFTNYQCFGIKE